MSPASKKPQSGKRYRRQDPERRRGERKWFDPAMRREKHALHPRQDHEPAGARIGAGER